MEMIILHLILLLFYCLFLSIISLSLHKFISFIKQIEDPLYIHPSSVLFRDLPDYVVFQESVETTKMYMKGVIAIEPHWLPIFAEQHCRFEDPLDEPAPTFSDEKGLESH